MEPSPPGPLPHSTQSRVEALLALSTDPSVSVGAVVQHAKVLAARIADASAAKWLDLELNGYPPGLSDEHPEWRRVGGPLRGQNPIHGWVPLDFEGDAELEAAVPETIPLKLSVAEIEKHLEAANGPMVEMPSLTKMCGVQVVMMLQKPHLVRVLTAVRSRVTDWALSLEARGFLPDPALVASAVERDMIVPLHVSRKDALLALGAQIASGERLGTNPTAAAFERWDSESGRVLREICLDHAVADDYEREESPWRPLDEPPGWAAEQLRRKLLVRLGRLRALAKEIEGGPRQSVGPAIDSPEDLVHLTPTALLRRLKLKHWWIVLGAFFTYSATLVGGAWWVRGELQGRNEVGGQFDVARPRGAERPRELNVSRAADAGIADASVPPVSD